MPPATQQTSPSIGPIQATVSSDAPQRTTVQLSIVAAARCPLYVKDDTFTLNGFQLTVCGSKPTCLILADDILHNLTNSASGAMSFRCGGCEGRVELRGGFVSSPAGERDPQKRARVEKLVRSLGHFSLFQTLDENELRKILPDLKVLLAEPGHVLIKQGQIGSLLYIIVEGKVDVLAAGEGVLLATLGPGEVFGEMSLLSGNVCTATIRAGEKARILTLEGGLFREMVQRYPSLQKFLFQLLAHRMRSTNLLKNSELSQGVRGALCDLSLPELLQALNISRKSGMVEVKLSRGTGSVAMREGEILAASYVGKVDCEAFYEMLTENDGTFVYTPALPPRFSGRDKIGDFMNLLMEGFVRIDEVAIQ